ncbi:hypothetical protein ACEPAF_7066 [Sanghuangporus sanghuang]
MRQDEAFISPFEETLARPDKLDLVLPKLGSLPALQNASGAIVYDLTASKTRYLLILGDAVNHNHPILICINLELNTWRNIRLKNAEKVPRGRSRASMIVIGDLRAPDSDVFLCLFGGVNEDPDTGRIRYLDTFAVANLSKSTWIIPDGTVPNDIGPLGAIEQRNSQEYVSPALFAHSIANAKAEFSKAYIFDPQKKNNQFAELDMDATSCCPRPARSFLLQPSQSTNKYCGEFLVVICGRQRSLNRFPGIPTEPDELESLYIKPRVEIWIATLHEPGGESGSASDRYSEVGEIKSDSEDSTSDDESSNDSSNTNITRREIRQNPLAQRAIRTGQAIVRKSEIVLTWQNMTGGRAKLSLQHLTESFRIEAMFLSGELSTRFEPAEYSSNHPLSPNLILLGSDHEFLGEIRVDLFNAVASISLRSLCEAEDDEVENSSFSQHLDQTMSIRSTTNFDELDEDMVLYDAIEPPEGIGETSSDESNEMTEDDMSLQARRTETWLALIADEQLDPSIVGRAGGTDPFLLSPRSEYMDVESE